MDTEHNLPRQNVHFPWHSWWAWTSLTTAGFILGGFAGTLSVLNQPSWTFTPVFLSRILSSLTVGVIIGFLQWLFLRRHLLHAWLWIPATATGILVGGIARSSFMWLVRPRFSAPSPLDWLEQFRLFTTTYNAVGWILVGALVGTLQALVLRRTHHEVRFWALLTTCGWGLGCLLSQAVLDADGPAFLSWGIAGVVVATTTASSLVLRVHAAPDR